MTSCIRDSNGRDHIVDGIADLIACQLLESSVIIITIWEFSRRLWVKVFCFSEAVHTYVKNEEYTIVHPVSAPAVSIFFIKQSQLLGKVVP